MEEKKKKLGSDPTFPIGAELLDRCGVVDFSPFGIDTRTYIATHIMQGLLSADLSGMYCQEDKEEEIAKKVVSLTDTLLRKLTE